MRIHVRTHVYINIHFHPVICGSARRSTVHTSRGPNFLKGEPTAVQKQPFTICPASLIKDVDLWRLHRPSTGLVVGLETGFLRRVQDLNRWKYEIFNPEPSLKCSKSSWSSSARIPSYSHLLTVSTDGAPKERFTSVGCFL